MDLLNRRLAIALESCAAEQSGEVYGCLTQCLWSSFFSSHTVKFVRMKASSQAHGMLSSCSWPWAGQRGHAVRGGGRVGCVDSLSQLAPKWALGLPGQLGTITDSFAAPGNSF